MATTDLRLTGMSCASCAAKIETGLNRIDCVTASVNFAVEQAHVDHDPTVTAAELIRAVEAVGYRASVIDHTHPDDHLRHDVPGDQLGERHADQVELRRADRMEPQLRWAALHGPRRPTNP